jgi:hypothetical protein
MHERNERINKVGAHSISWVVEADKKADLRGWLQTKHASATATSWTRKKGKCMLLRPDCFSSAVHCWSEQKEHAPVLLHRRFSNSRDLIPPVRTMC